jgi:hypothetical protein
VNKEIKNADIEKITVDYATRVRETEEEFIFQTITPFCFNILLKIISKKELKDTLLRGEQMKWIPCSERLPEEPKENPVFDGKCLEVYLVTTKCGSSDQDKVYPFRAFWNGINFTDGCRILDVIAWMPLPETYKENEDE